MIAVVTIVSGRHCHLAAGRAGLASGTRTPDLDVVVSMGDPDVPGAVLTVPREEAALPLARARNAGAEAAITAGADLLIFLDVDCIPGPDLIALYALHARDDALLVGPVTYLPQIEGPYPDDLSAWTRPHAARPDPPAGEVIRGANYDLFWSLSFAVTPATWHTIGGFCEDYSGYGGEDTDFAETARRVGVDLLWVGGAHAYHQWHPVSSPPVEHLGDIVVNAATFHRRWGCWPMTGWLRTFRERGLIDWDEQGSTIAVCPPKRPTP